MIFFRIVRSCERSACFGRTFGTMKGIGAKIEFTKGQGKQTIKRRWGDQGATTFRPASPMVDVGRKALLYQDSFGFQLRARTSTMP